MKVDIFKEGEKVNVLGISKGKGFTGSIKSITFPENPKAMDKRINIDLLVLLVLLMQQRFSKEKNYPGRMGNETVKVKNIEIVRVDLIGI